jgi:hypothetical protein
MTAFKTALLASASVVALVAGADFAASPAMAASAKFAAEVSNFELVPTSVCSTSNTGTNTCSSSWTTVLSTTIKTPNQKDLLIGGSLETGVGTETKVAAKNGNNSTSSASATIKVRVLVDGQAASICGGSTCPNGVAYPFEVTYNARVQNLSATLLGTDCTANLTTGVVTCSSPEIIDLLIKTTSANSFNFVAPNLTPGTHSVELQVEVAESASSDTLSAGASATAEVGVGTLTVQDVQATTLPQGITFTD